MFTSMIPRKSSSLSNWQGEMNRLINQMNREFNTFDTSLSSSFEVASPKIEVKEKESGYRIKAEIPGMEEKDLNITLQDNCLVIEGEKKTESSKEGDGQTFSEFSYGSFYRTIPLSAEVDPERVTASYKHGVLTVDLEKTKSAQSKAKKIQIAH